jgi:hypothetical protein
MKSRLSSISGATLNSLDLERKKTAFASNGRPVKPEIVFDHLMEGIVFALDIPGDRMFMTDLGGSLHTASLDGAAHKTLPAVQGNLTGAAYTDQTNCGYSASHNRCG